MALGGGPRRSSSGPVMVEGDVGAVQDRPDQSLVCSAPSVVNGRFRRLFSGVRILLRPVRPQRVPH
jgi:hypothetical protein